MIWHGIDGLVMENVMGYPTAGVLELMYNEHGLFVGEGWEMKD